MKRQILKLDYTLILITNFKVSPDETIFFDMSLIYKANWTVPFTVLEGEGIDLHN